MECRLTMWQRISMTAVLALAFSMEQADVGVLQSMYGPIGRSLQVSAVALGTLTTWRGVVQAVATPFVGSAGNVLNRIFLASAGTFIWGITSVGMGAAHSFSQAAAFSSLNGIGLCLVLSSVQSALADIYRPEHRGKAFGVMLTAASAGQIVFNFMAIAVGGRQVGTQEGWRFVFYMMAGVAGLTTILLLIFGIEPRNLNAKPPKLPKPKLSSPARGTVQRAVGALKAIISDAHQVFGVWSFVVILLAETIMVCGGAGAGYQVLYFQITGFTDVDTATLNLCFNVGNAVGMATGGFIGDALATRFPRFARPLVNQASMVIVAPLFLILYKGLPGSSLHTNGVPGHLHDLSRYGILLFFMTIVAPWEQANNAAMFAEVLPENLRSSGYAFDKGVTGLLGALAAPLVGLLAEKAWGSRGITDNSAAAVDAATDPSALQATYAKNIHNARALENALLSVMIAAMGLRALVYGLLYFTLPRDRAAVQEKESRTSGCPADNLAGNHSDMRTSDRQCGMERWASYPPHARASTKKYPAGSKSEMQRFVSLPHPLDSHLP